MCRGGDTRQLMVLNLRNSCEMLAVVCCAEARIKVRRCHYTQQSINKKFCLDAGTDFGLKVPECNAAARRGCSRLH